MVKVAIHGATGYGGVELIRLLRLHPHVSLTHLTSESYAGQLVSDVYPHLAGVDLPLQKLDPQAAAECDFALLAVPAGLAMGVAPALLEAGARIIDVSPDFRLRQADTYTHWFKAQVDAAKLPGNLHLHSLRHTFITFALQHESHWRVKDHVDHSDIRVTEGYAHTDVDDGKEINIGFDLRAHKESKTADGS